MEIEVTEVLTIIVLFGFYFYSLYQNRLSKTVLTLPLLMMGFGLVLAWPIETYVHPEDYRSINRVLAEITLVLVLFSDASSIRFSVFEKIWRFPLRMLLIGMPLSIALGSVLTFWVEPSLGILMAVLIASVLAPTDAALAQPVVTSKGLPPRLSETLNVESGLNDGLAVPFVFGAATLLAGNTLESPLRTVLVMLIVAPIVGGVVGYVTAKLLDRAKDLELAGESSASVVYILTPFLAYLCSEVLGGNGFIAAFVGGMVFGNVARDPVESISRFMESEGQILKMASFFLFGALILPDAFAYMSWKHLVLAVLFLSVIRMAPVYLSLWGTHLSSKDKLFLGWFGPRGLASILYIFLVSESYDIPNYEEFFAIVSLTVLLSVLLHGVSAMPIVRNFVKTEGVAAEAK